jgi:phospholipase/carboxylesterase
MSDRLSRPRVLPTQRYPSRGFTRREFLAAGLAPLAASSLLACGEDPMGLDSGQQRIEARPVTPTLPAPVGESSLGLGSSRDGILYVPESYSPESPAPLFVALHGAGGRGRDWTGFFDAAENRGMVLLAPDSRVATWDRTRGDFGRDVRFLNRALAHTFERCRIDPDRIALAGFSDGASYALSLGVSNGDLFSHLTAFSPGFMAPKEPLVGKPGVFVSHGDEDPILSFSNTAHSLVPSLRDGGYDVTFMQFSGGHEVPIRVGTAALDWFLG